MLLKTQNIPHQKHTFQHLSQAKHLGKASGREIKGKGRGEHSRQRSHLSKGRKG